MRLTDGGYSTVMFNTGMLQATAKALSTRIPEVMHEVGADCVAVTGKSGIALAFATLALVHFPILVVRKVGEKSHGNPIEGTHNHRAARYLVLDDFVCTGDTLRAIRDSINNYSYYTQETAPKMAGVLCYATRPFAGATTLGVPAFGLHADQQLEIDYASQWRAP